MFIACWRTCTALFVDSQWKPCYTVIILRIIFIIFPFHKKRFMEWSSCFERSWGSTNAAHREIAELFGRILNCNLFRQWFALWHLCASPYNVLLLFVLPQKVVVIVSESLRSSGRVLSIPPGRQKTRPVRFLLLTSSLVDPCLSAP